MNPLAVGTSTPRYPSQMMAAIQETIGFIGSGRMATALARGCAGSGLVVPQQLLAADPSRQARASFADVTPGARLADGNAQVLREAQIIVLAVKPQIMADVLAEIAEYVQPEHLIVSIAAGVTLDTLAEALPAGTRLVRVMPNTPCLVGVGASCFSRGSAASEDDAQRVQQILLSVGSAYEVEEQLLDAVTGLSGSGPAFVYRVIEAMARGGQAGGLPAKMAVELAALTARGAAEMVLQTGDSPDALCQQVTSPGGTTLAGLEVLRERSGPEAFRAAVEVATKRSQELGKRKR